MNRDTALPLLRQQFRDLTTIDDDLVRAENEYAGAPFGVFYFDFGQKLSRNDFDLDSYLQRYIAKDFYNHEGSLQWNYYVYFVLEKERFEILKRDGRASKIEADRTFARKFVREASHFREELSKPIASAVTNVTVSRDIAALWTEELKAASLGRICDPIAPYDEIVRQFLSGNETHPPIQPDAPARNHVQRGQFLEFLRIEKFRAYPVSNEFEFGTVNLIRGANGSGKTSLLEAIELSICGGVRRQDGGCPPDAKLWARFRGETQPHQHPVRNSRMYRERDQEWYSAYYRQGNELCHNFSRFNFFDSDAAFRLSSANTRQAIRGAIEALFLGDLANTIEERMRSCKDRFDREHRELSKKVAAYENDLVKLSSDIEKLKQIKDTKEALLKELRAKTTTAGWRGSSNRIHVNDLAVLQESTEEVLSQLSDYIHQLRWLPNISFAALKDEAAHLSDVLKDIKVRRSSAEKLHESLRKARSELEGSNAEMKVLLRLQEYHNEPDALSLNGFRDVLKATSERIEALNEAAELMRTVDKETFENSSATVEALFAERQLEVVKQRKQVAQKRKRIAELTAHFGAVKALIQQIKGLGQHLCETDPKTKSCPLCAAEYEGGLADRIKSLEENSSDDASIRQMTADVNRDEKVLKDLEKLCQGLTNLQQAAELILQPEHVLAQSVKELVASLGLVGDRLTNEKKKFQELRAKEKILKQRGFSQEELENLLATAVNDYEVSSNKLTGADTLANLVTGRRERHAALSKKAKELEKDNKLAEEELYRLIKKAVNKVDVDEACVEIERRKTLLQDASDAVRRIQKTCDFLESEELSVVKNRLKSFCDSVSRIHATLKRVEEKDLLEEQYSKRIDEAKNRLAQVKPERDRANQALSLLSRLLGANSKADYLSAVVDQHREKLVAIFRGIHAPHEFCDIVISEDVFLNRHSGTRSAVHEISTGQRSALALSIFLSMNSSVSDRAPWLIFDDPVAHVDDLNTLSFFDRLRDLVLLGSRQVFFATASTRIANLFARKFDFLGQSTFKEFVLERPS